MKKNEQKARMVINYKRLNDNTYDDAYNIPNKDSLLIIFKDVDIFLN